MEKLSEQERSQSLEPLVSAGWRLVEGRDAITKAYEFSDFVSAFGWMTQVAIWAQTWDHHPEWSNVYRKVDVTLTTHDANGLTALDIKLAKKMEQIAQQMR